MAFKEQNTYDVTRNYFIEGKPENPKEGHLDIWGDGRATIKHEDGPLAEPPQRESHLTIVVLLNGGISKSKQKRFYKHTLTKFVCKSVCKTSNSLIFICIVEMGGLEPPSKHSTQKLSTRLFCHWLSGRGCGQTRHQYLIF